ncbi:MAG: hypothetical protein AAEJ57_08165, partial [Opitutales bacterium]
MFLGLEKLPFAKVEPVAIDEQANLCGYQVEGDTVRFAVSKEKFPRCFHPLIQIYFASSINGWEKAIGNPAWEMKIEEGESSHRFALNLPLAALLEKGPFSFKFVTGESQWLEVSEASPNREIIEPGRYNLRFDPEATGNRIFRFEMPAGQSLAHRNFLTWDDGEHREAWPLFYYGDLLELYSESPMGA